MSQIERARNGTRPTAIALVPPLTAVMLAALALAGCGVKSAPAYPPDATYPRQYPQALPPLDSVSQKEQQKRTQTYSGGPALPPVRTAPPTGIYQYPNPPSYIPPKQ